MSVLIRDATILTVDMQGTVHAPGALLVEGNAITDLGPSDEVAGRAPPDATVIDGEGRIVLPGFVSAHNHLGYTVFRGRAEDIGHSPTHRLYLPMSLVMTREERKALGALAIVELLRGGVTTVLEMEEDADVLAPCLEAAGMRAGIGIMTHDVDLARLHRGETVFDDDVRREQLAQALGFAERWHNAADGRIQAVITTNGLSTSSPALLRALRAAADRLGVPLSIHLASGEMHLVQQVHGKHSFDYARENGFLAEDVIAVHCYKIDERGIDTMAETGTRLAHCPLMNQFRGGIAPLQLMRERGIQAGLGIDNYFSDFFDLIRACISSARIRAGDPEVMPSSDALALATIESARVMGIDDQVGSLEVGKRADLQIVDTRRYGLTPVTDPIATLLYHAHAKDVETVMVDGRMVVENGTPLWGDEEALIDGAARAGHDAWQRFHARFGAYSA